MTPSADDDIPFSLVAVPAGEAAWTLDDTQSYLTANPLPPDFRWRHRDFPADLPQPVHPSHKSLKGGYGKWLRETPYFPGLFERVHGIIVDAGDSLPDAEQIASELRRRYGHTSP